jgi:SlyX protein
MTEDDRLNELESKLAFQERTINELNQVVYEQDGQISRLEDACRELAAELKILTEKLGDDLSDEKKPPHY